MKLYNSPVATVVAVESADIITASYGETATILGLDAGKLNWNTNGSTNWGSDDGFGSW